MENAVIEARRKEKRARITAGSARAKLAGLTKRIRQGAQNMAGKLGGTLTSGMSDDSGSLSGLSNFSLTAHAQVRFQETSPFRERPTLDTEGLEEVQPCQSPSNAFSPKSLLKGIRRST